MPQKNKTHKIGTKRALWLSLAILGGLSVGALGGYFYPLKGVLHSNTNLTPAQEKIVQMIMQQKQQRSGIQSATGAYLIAQHAEFSSDWQGTYSALKELDELTDLPPSQTARFFLASIAQGDWQRVQELLDDHRDDIISSSPIVRLLVSIILWDNEQDEQASELIKEIDYSPLSQPIAPYTKGWITGETPILNVFDAAQDISYSSLNMVRFFEANDDFERADMLMTKLQEADLSLALTIWSHQYFVRRGMDELAQKTAQQMELMSATLPQDLWQQEYDRIVAEADGHLHSSKRALALTLVDATDILESYNASAIALLYAQLAKKLAPDLNNIDFVLASIYENQGNLDDANSMYNKIDKNAPNYVSAQLLIANNYIEMERFDDARQLYKNLTEQFSQNAEIFYQQGEFLRAALSDYREAIFAYDRAEKIFGGSVPEAYWSLYLARGLCYELLGELDRAEKDYKAALALQPNNPEILNTIAYSWTEQNKNLDEALAMLKQALEITPDAPHILDSYGWVLYKMERYDEALPFIERASSAVPYDMTVNDHLGDVYMAVGREREAIYMWERALNRAESDEDRAKIQQKLNQ